MKKIRIGVMGCASIAKRSMIPAILSLPEHFELVAIASREKQKAVEFSSEFRAEPIEGYQNLADRTDIDAIYMPLPTGLHEEWIIKSLERKKHLLVEKSLALNHASMGRMAGLAVSNKLLLMESFMFRYHSQHQYTWKVLREKKIGNVRLFRSQFGFPPLDPANFRYEKMVGGGALLDAGAYTVKAAQWFLGQNLKVASATLFIDPARSVDVYGSATLVNEEGISAQLAFGFDNFYQCNYEFWGSTGRLKAEKAFTPKITEETVIKLEKQGESHNEKLHKDNHFINILKEFHRSILKEDHESHIQECLSQSRILTEIQTKADKFNI